MGADSCDTMRLKVALCHTIADVTDVSQHPVLRDAMKNTWQWRWRHGRSARFLLSWWAEEHGEIGYDLALVSYGAHW